ncbi:MAG: sugar phosphate isomerase/epimerase [Thaumarchaeota archaeon]|nr:sugar phosphate isomerase/epimerase [Nitrososphaerota archaeon]
MKTAIATILWGKLHTIDDFREVLSQVKGIGYDGIGFETKFLPKELLKDPSRIPPLLRDHALENAGSYSGMLESEVEWAAESRTPLLWVVVRREKKFREALKRLEKFSKLANKSSVIPALHNHLKTCFETEEQVAEALERIEGLKLCFDTAHARAMDIDSANFIRRFRNQIALVHLKDLRAKVPKSRVSFSKDFVNVGSGIVDFKIVMEALSEVRYKGTLMLELDSARGKKPEELAREGFERVMDLVQLL